MREILFRGKRLDNGEWIEGSLWLHGEIARIFDIGDFPDGCDWVEVDPETVGQYTGLTDRKGKKIFEGDIVKYGSTVNEVVFENRNGTAFFGVAVSDVETWYFCYMTNAEGMEVIGNIHDNPYLLEGNT